MAVVFKYTTSLTVLLSLTAFSAYANAESFMDTWLARQKETVAASNLFDQDGWLARQKAKNQDEWLANQAVSQSTASTFDSDAWLARQEDTANSDGTFSQQSWAPATSWEADEDLEKSLLSDVEEALGKEHRLALESRTRAIEKDMQPMFQALPKNEYGKLGHSSARYMLHRFFVEQHGWFIDGLFTEGAALNTSSPSHMLKDRVPMFVEGLFEKRLVGRGFGVHEMAVLVAVVEDSVHEEAHAELKKTYKALGVPLESNFSADNVEMLIEVYMSGFVMNTNMSNVSRGELYRQRRDMILYYPTWTMAQEFFKQVEMQHMSGRQTASFEEVSAIVRQLVNTFGTFHGKQCQGLKQTLQGLQQNGSTGCVNLQDFYAKGLKADTNWLFVESPEYLRHIGVLDEHNPQNPRLLAANYINSPTNCLQPSGYYMVCCHNECDDILSYLERRLGSSTATPIEVVAALRGATNNGIASSLRTKQIPHSLRRRLEEIAEYHDGRVPIHGRLFQQFLHHVYPNECSYPHISGSKNPQWMEDFEEETGKVSQLTGTEMESFVLNASRATPPMSKTLSADAGSCAPWDAEEELFAPLPQALPLHALEDDPHVWNVAGSIAFLAAASTLTITLIRSCRTMAKLKYEPKMLVI